MALRVLTRLGKALRGSWKTTATGVILLLGATALVMYLSIGGRQPTGSGSAPSCPSTVIRVIANQTPDLPPAKACLSGMTRFASMSDADFARFAQASMSAQAQQTVLVG